MKATFDGYSGEEDFSRANKLVIFTIPFKNRVTLQIGKTEIQFSKEDLAAINAYIEYLVEEEEADE